MVNIQCFAWLDNGYMYKRVFTEAFENVDVFDVPVDFGS